MIQQPLVKDTVVRMALACWCVDPAHGMTPSQHTWLTMRLKDQRPLTPAERAQVRAPLLAWCQRCGGERLAALVLRQYDAVTAAPQEVAP
jgi:hypothetical protein